MAIQIRNNIEEVLKLRIKVSAYDFWLTGFIAGFSLYIGELLNIEFLFTGFVFLIYFYIYYKTGYTIIGYFYKLKLRWIKNKNIINALKRLYMAFLNNYSSVPASFSGIKYNQNGQFLYDKKFNTYVSRENKFIENAEFIDIDKTFYMKWFLGYALKGWIIIMILIFIFQDFIPKME